MTRVRVHDLTMPGDELRHEWSAGFARFVAEEIRSGVQGGALSWAEADELLARLRTVVDQALDLSPLPG